MPRTTIVGALRTMLILVPVLCALLGSGCGDADQSGNSVPPTATQAATDPTPPVVPDRQPPVEPDPVPSPDFVVHGKNNEGDRISVAGTVAGDPVPADQVGLDADALGQCGAGSGRSYALQLDLTTTVTTAVPARVVVGSIGDPLLGATQNDEYLNSIIVAGDGTRSCTPSITLGEMQPNSPVDTTVWLLLNNAITPNDPNPSRESLARTLIIGAPVIATTSGPMPSRMTGRPVKRCRTGQVISLLDAKIRPREGSGFEASSCA